MISVEQVNEKKGLPEKQLRAKISSRVLLYLSPIKFHVKVQPPWRYLEITVTCFPNRYKDRFWICSKSLRRPSSSCIRQTLRPLSLYQRDVRSRRPGWKWGKGGQILGGIGTSREAEGNRENIKKTQMSRKLNVFFLHMVNLDTWKVNIWTLRSFAYRAMSRSFLSVWSHLVIPTHGVTETWRPSSL